MPTDVYTLPFEGINDHQRSHSVLRFCGFVGSIILDEFGKKLIELIEKAKENNQFVPERFYTHFGYEHGKEYFYGEAEYPLPYVFVRDLLELEKLHGEYYKEEDDDPIYCINKEKALGTMGYLKTLPKNRRIAIYWDD